MVQGVQGGIQTLPGISIWMLMTSDEHDSLAFHTNMPMDVVSMQQYNQTQNVVALWCNMIQ